MNVVEWRKPNSGLWSNLTAANMRMRAKQQEAEQEINAKIERNSSEAAEVSRQQKQSIQVSPSGYRCRHPPQSPPEKKAVSQRAAEGRCFRRPELSRKWESIWFETRARRSFVSIILMSLRVCVWTVAQKLCILSSSLILRRDIPTPYTYKPTHKHTPLAGPSDTWCCCASCIELFRRSSGVQEYKQHQQFVLHRNGKQQIFETICSIRARARHDREKGKKYTECDVER